MSKTAKQRRLYTAAISTLTALALAACGGGGGDGGTGSTTVAGAGGSTAPAPVPANTPANTPAGTPANPPENSPAPAPVAAQRVQLPVTTEIVNPGEAGEFFSPQVARLTGGGYVIAWAALPAGSSTDSVCFQRYGADGARSGSESCVNGAQTLGNTSIVARADGGFTITWLGGGDTPGVSLHWQDYDAAGNAQGAIQSGAPPLALRAQRLAGGGFVELLQTDGPDPSISLQLYAADGTPIGSPKPVADGAKRGQGIVALTGGGFAVAWVQFDPTGVMTRAFSADGTPLGDPVEVAPNTLGPVNCGKSGAVAICQPFQNGSGITATDDGGYIVAWVDGTGVGELGDTFARQFRADGSAASAVIGRIASGVSGPIAAVSPDEFVLTIGDNGASDIAALHVAAQTLR